MFAILFFGLKALDILLTKEKVATNLLWQYRHEAMENDSSLSAHLRPRESLLLRVIQLHILALIILISDSFRTLQR
jgi:hypothetical protein